MKRPFKGLRKEEPKERYDAVIIGAGVGGLVLANLLARAGLEVLLLEQHYMAGGYCSTFRRKGFTFDAATHFYPLLGNPTTLTGRLLVELGIETGWIKMDPVDTFHFPDGSKFHVPADLETYLREVKALFPEEAENLDRFFAEVRQAYMKGLMVYFRGRSTDYLGPLAETTVRDALDRHFRDPKLKLLLTADCPHWGGPPNRTSFVFDSMLRLSYFLGNYYPELGSQNFADELAWRFEERGGHIFMSTRVDEILVEDGKASGVVIETDRGALKGRRTVRAETVVSNADLLLTYERLLPREVVDPAYLEMLRGLRTSYPCYLTHVGLEGADPAALDAAQGYYWNTWNPDEVGRGALRCKIFNPTHYEPRMAPEGGQIVILQKVIDVDYDAIDDWDAHKAEVEDYVVSHFENVVPEAREKIVVKLTASARTSWRFTLNRAGAMLGWEMSPDQLGDDRPGIEGPVPGLYLVGHWIQPGGGITPVIVSAVQAAEKIIGGASIMRSLSAGAVAMPGAPRNEAVSREEGVSAGAV